MLISSIYFCATMRSLWYKSKFNCIILFNHNKDTSGGGEGAEVIYALRNNNELSDLVLEEIGKEGQVLRKAYQRRLPSSTSKDYYFIHRNTGITEPIIVEYGFLDTEADANRLKNNYERYAEAVVRAVSEYIGLPSTQNTYTVKKGDSLWSIAKKYNTTVEQLKAANNLTSNLLNIGQVLKIPQTEVPVEPGDYTVYTVVSGDNLYNIARRYNLDVKDIADYNNLSTTNLSIGQRLLIPTKTVPTPSEGYQTYIVKKGDNLYSIANKYNTTVDEIKSLNNLTSNILSINQKLLIPSTKANTYTVKKGDNLYSIARNYNTTVDEIKRKNNLTSNILSIGQVLKI